VQPEAKFELWVAGWSDRDAKSAFFSLASHDTTRAHSNAMPFAYGPAIEGEHNGEWITKLADLARRSSGDSRHELRECFTALATQQREMFGCIGGELNLATVTRNAVDVETVHRWSADRIGAQLRGSVVDYAGNGLNEFSINSVSLEKIIAGAVTKHDSATTGGTGALSGSTNHCSCSVTLTAPAGRTLRARITGTLMVKNGGFSQLIQVLPLINGSSVADITADTLGSNAVARNVYTGGADVTATGSSQTITAAFNVIPAATGYEILFGTLDLDVFIS
jgi:hypothetical protein